MKTPLALLSITIFTAMIGFILYSIGVGDHHADPIWALGTSVVFLTVLLIDVWMFFAIAGEEAYQWKI
ncbi:MAG: hypothetical protein GKR92_11750 [Gammaproteobacteria bacterium]|nr:MAG: hypothetical protein GKR92_11750 [Gammaproteobacteria bacterium]